MGRGGASHTTFTVLDLFSGVGGMSFGFAARPEFRLVGAIDAEQAKPTSSGLDCNRTYEINIGIRPDNYDLASFSPSDYRQILEARYGKPFTLDVLIACAPCTGFSQVLPENRRRDHMKNSLVERCALWVAEFKPKVFIMENLAEMLAGIFRNHFFCLKTSLLDLGYTVSEKVINFRDFGLPQVRRRAVIISVARGLTPRHLDDFWAGLAVKPEATTVRRAIGQLSASDPAQRHPQYTESVLRLLQAIPADGGSWPVYSFK